MARPGSTRLDGKAARAKVWSALAGVAVAGLPGCGGVGRPSGVGGTEHALLGAPAPAFEVPRQNGPGTVSLESARGKVALVDFWATWCEPCRESFPAYQALADRHAGSLEVLAISVDESTEGVGAFAEKAGVKFPVGWDEGQRVSEEWKPPGMPSSFLVDRNGLVRFVHSGFRAGDEVGLGQEVASLLE